MAPPSEPTYVGRSGGYDFATASDNEDDVTSVASTSASFAGGETTILGFADGFMRDRDLVDFRQSKVGGLPSFPVLPKAELPASSASICQACGQPMPLLTQIYCPLPTSLHERALYVFGCPSPGCRRQPGAVRAFRVNIPWIEETEDEAMAEEDEAVQEQEQPKVMLGSSIFGGPAVNPAAVGGGAFNPFAPPPALAAGANPFAPAPKAPVPNPFAPAPAVLASPANPFAPKSAAPALSANLAAFAPKPAPASSDLSGSLAALSLAAPPAPPAASSSTWPASYPAYPAQYVTTAYEPAAPSTKASRAAAKAAAALEAAMDHVEDVQDGHREGKAAGGRVKKATANVPAGKVGGGDGWGQEGYEVQKLKGVDEVFLRFQERVAREPSQLVRYDPAAQPVPFSAVSAPSQLLFPAPPGADPSAGPFAYAPAKLGGCAHCQGPVRFELQLMPALVGVLNRVGENKQAVGVASGELDFATVWVFSCEYECGMEESLGVVGEGVWREEKVEVEWED